MFRRSPFQPRQAIAVSFALHALLAFFLLQKIHWPHSSPKSLEHALFVDLAESPAAVGKAGIGKIRRSVLGAGGLKSIPFSALAPSWSPLPGGGSVGTTNAESSSISSEAIVKPKSSGAMSWVYRKTEQVLGYPQPFIRHEIQGSVVARISFDQNGKFDPSRIVVDSDSPYLRVYVYRLLEKTYFDDPIPLSLRNWKDRLDVICQVRFTFTETTVSFDIEQKIAGNRMFFAKKHPQSKLQWRLGPLGGMGPAVGLDLLWFARKATEATSHHVEIDDLEPYKSDPLFYN
jgi:hypothetical protein